MGVGKVRKSKLLYLTMQQLLFLMYFLISYFIYTVAVKQGNEGVTIQILGGKDDGFFYWEQVKKYCFGRYCYTHLNLPLNDWHSR